MKKILIITPRFPYPVIGGDRLRIYHICKELSKHYTLNLISLCETQDELNMPIPSDNIFNNVERFLLPKWQSWFNCICALPTNMPLQVAYFKNTSFSRRVFELASHHDAIFSHLIRSGDIVKNLPTIKFLEMTDAISLNYSRIANKKFIIKDFRSRVFSFESKRLKKYEQSIVRFFDHSFLVSDIDYRFLFNSNPDSSKFVSVCTIGVDLLKLPYNFNTSEGDLIFIGNMTTLQNLDAVNYMVYEIWPLVRRVKPNLTLKLIGRISGEHASRYESVAGVKVSGEVPQISTAARGGGVGVCPLRLGAGVQFKILEYMALGLPTVATSLGLEGLKATPGRDLLVSDDAFSFADSILKLLNNRDKAERISLAARMYVESFHSWSSTLEPMMSIIDNKLIDMDE